MKWISVNERLPEYNIQAYWYNDDNKRVPWEGRKYAEVLAYNEHLGIFKARYEYGKWIEIASSLINGTEKAIPTHWMPLPEPPTNLNQ